VSVMVIVMSLPVSVCHVQGVCHVSVMVMVMSLLVSVTMKLVSATVHTTHMVVTVSSVMTATMVIHGQSSPVLSHVGSGVVRIDLLHFLAGCRRKRLNLALSVLSLSLIFLSVSVVLLTRVPFCVMLFLWFVSWLIIINPPIYNIFSNIYNILVVLVRL